ncbi:MAG: sensor histidine kinase [Cyclobacteriaceae bacterium]|nr:sensor histidine kinase [Cyclobacteriaceae bacterium]
MGYPFQENKTIEYRADPYVIKDSLDQETLGKNIDFIEDKDHSLTIHDLLKEGNDIIWNQNASSIPSFGYSNSSFWFRVSLAFDLSEGKARQYFLEVDNPLLDTINCYLTRGDQISEAWTFGDHYPFHEREIEHRDFIYPLTLPVAKDTVTLYFNIKSASSISLPLTIWEQKAFIETDQDRNMMMGLYFGVLLILIFYNLYIYFSTRDNIYLYYILCVFSILGLILSLNGIGFQYFWPRSPYIQKVIAPIFVSMVSLFIVQFSRKFLSLKNRNLFLDTIAKWIIRTWIASVILLPILISSWFFSAIVALSILNIIFTLFIGGVSHLKGYQPARFFVAGWLFFLFWLILYAFAVLGVIRLTFFISNGFFFGVTFGLALISIAMADKIRILARKREKVQRKVFRLLEIDREKNQMINVVAHDLKTPLNQIKGFINLIQSDGIQSMEEKEGYLHQINEVIDRLNEMVTKILDVNSLDQSKLNIKQEPTDIALVVEKVLKGFYPVARRKRQAIITDLVKGVHFAMIDKDFLFQIVENLLSNASKFSDPDKSIHVKIKEKEGRVRISVKDQGPGISQADQKRLFIPFKKLNAKPTGDESSSGLGLSIVKKYVEAMGGTITCKSRDSNGATFIVAFPSLSTLQQDDAV